MLAIQSSGVGNCINAFSLVTNCRFPFFSSSACAASSGGNPWQVPMGRITEETLRLAGFHVFRALNEDEAAALVAGGLAMAFVPKSGRGASVAAPARRQESVRCETCQKV